MYLLLYKRICVCVCVCLCVYVCVWLLCKSSLNQHLLVHIKHTWNNNYYFSKTNYLINKHHRQLLIISFQHSSWLGVLSTSGKKWIYKIYLGDFAHVGYQFMFVIVSKVNIKLVHSFKNDPQLSYGLIDSIVVDFDM